MECLNSWKIYKGLDDMRKEFVDAMYKLKVVFVSDRAIIKKRNFLDAFYGFLYFSSDFYCSTSYEWNPKKKSFRLPIQERKTHNSHSDTTELRAL